MSKNKIIYIRRIRIELVNDEIFQVRPTTQFKIRLRNNITYLNANSLIYGEKCRYTLQN